MSDDIEITIRANNGQAVRAFRDTQGQLRDMRGRFVSESRIMSAALGGITQAAGGAAGGLVTLKGAAVALGAAVGVSLLPAVGALVPLMAGAGVAAGTLALGFNGVGDAVKLAGEDQKKYSEALKKMSPAQREFTEAIVGTKKEFSGVGREVQKAMLPGFTKAVKDAKPVVKIFSDSMVDLGGTFGTLAEKAGRAMKDSGLQGDLRKNLQLGTGAIEEMATATGPLVKSLLDFGAKSKPSLDAITGLATGLMDTGLPKFFAGLEPGIKGSASVIDGLAYAVNDNLLPAFGEFSGQFAKLVGPVLGEGLKLLGDLGSVAFEGLALRMKMMAPLFNDVANGIRGIRTFAADVAPTLRDVGAALASVFVPADYTSMTGPLTSLADAIDRNKGAIQEGARVFGLGVLSISEAVIDTVPNVIEMFRLMSTGVLAGFDGIVSGAAMAFGWIPGIGDKLEAANTKFDSFRDAFIGGLESAESQASSFAASAAPKLAAGKLQLSINNWSSQIETAKEQLKSVPPEKRAALRAHIADLQAKVRQAKAELASVHDKTVSLTTIVTTTRKSVHEVVGATGGLFTGKNFRYAEGGPVVGPGTGTSDDVFAPWLSNGEFVIKAASVAKYGEKFLQRLNDGQLDMPKFAKGGLTQGQKDARKGLSASFGISHFGAMAGYATDPFQKSLGAPADVGALVSSLNQLRGQIKAAFSGGKESSLLKTLDSAGRKLIAWEKQLTKVEASLSKARDKLNSLRDAASSLSSSVKSGVLTSANITRGANAENGAPITVASIMGGLTESRDKATAFSSALAQLKKKGLSSALIQQIGEAGIEGGGLETAGALLGASSSEIKSLNDLQSQIGKAAASAGKTTADAVYAAQIKAQADLVHKLDAQQNKLIKSMDNLAKSMEKLLQQALGGKAAGGIVGAASGGIRSNRTWVGEHGPELLDLPAGSRVWSNPDSRRMAAAPWASMLNTPQHRASAPARAAAAGTGGGEPIVIQLQIGKQKFGELWVDVGRNEVRARGGIDATLKPPRGR